jgi:predicted glycosyltransferase
MKILFHIAHPAQYHMFKHLIANLRYKGHLIKVTINTKDILEQLLIEDNVSYLNILRKRRQNNNDFSALMTLLKKDLQILRIQHKENFDMMVGTETALSHVGWLYRKPTLIVTEDDVSVIPDAAKMSFPFAKYIVSPTECNIGKWTPKKISYEGYQKIAYLHPRYFKPQKAIVNKVVDVKERFFLIRTSALSAYHDQGVKGLSERLIRKIIKVLTPFGKVLISTERNLRDDLKKYALRANVSDIHHFLYYADFIIADSQSMCVEASILGTPSIRFSDFSGKIGVLNELEYKYGLTFGVTTDNEDELLAKVNYLLGIHNLKEIWHSKKDRMLQDKVDVTLFWTWLIDAYPYSIHLMKTNPNYQRNFKFV